MSNGESHRFSPLPIDVRAAAVQAFELSGQAMFPAASPKLTAAA